MIIKEIDKNLIYLRISAKSFHLHSKDCQTHDHVDHDHPKDNTPSYNDETEDYLDGPAGVSCFIWE